MSFLNPRTRSALQVPLSAIALAACAATATATTDNHYGVTISKAHTRNMSFSGGVYSATADNAVLNVHDLSNALAAGSVTVTTGTGTGGDAKGDLHVTAPFKWSGANGLAFIAYRTIFVEQLLTDAGSGALSLSFNKGGSKGILQFTAAGSITIRKLSAVLNIGGHPYKLIGDLPSLAKASPTGFYALANSYDASADGTYHVSPIPQFSGVFNGLGNAILHLTIVDNTQDDNTALFGKLNNAKISDFRLENESVTAKAMQLAGGLAADAQQSLIESVRVTGTITGSNATGGLVGVNANGVIKNCSTDVMLKSPGQSIGGLTASNQGLISQSFVEGTTQGTQDNSIVGALVGWNEGLVEDSYATGSVIAKFRGTIGGLIGYSDFGDIERNYSTGKVRDRGGVVGGLIGADANGQTALSYWNLETSGVSNPGQGAGSPADDPGITGLTTAQFQSGLPEGFSDEVWAQDKRVNKGFPYLRQNLPE